jgi:hypothetical protein
MSWSDSATIPARARSSITKLPRAEAPEPGFLKSMVRRRRKESGLRPAR